MANRSDKHPLNVPGPLYNDLSCIDCDLCREIAPAFFRRDEVEGQTYVWHQPATPEEWEVAREAAQSCPTETIGCDG